MPAPHHLNFDANESPNKEAQQTEETQDKKE